MSRADPVEILAELVSFRTDVDGLERPLADRLATMLRDRGADEVVTQDVPRARGNPASFVYARYGEPKLLVNAHLDTVPPNADWKSDPFVAKVEGERLTALGAADTKGAAAAVLAALDDARPTDTAILFSGDEEFTSVAMRAFVEGPYAAGLERAIVCEPTSLRAGARHRGIVSLEVDASGPGGHSSFADELPAPVSTLARLAVTLDEWGRARRAVGPPGFHGMCLNVAKLDGGVAFNVVPAHARLTVSLRPPPGSDAAALRRELEALVAGAFEGAVARFTRDNPPFQTRDLSAFVPMLGDTARAPLDLGFWTEAALLAQKGIDAVVWGPGDIAVAHAPNEWVPLDDLRRARETFRALFARRAA